MHVRIRLFARLREITGAGELERDVPEGATTRTIWDRLTADFPGLVPYAAVVSCAVNEEYSTLAAPVHEGDEIAFLPPVSGGLPGPQP